MPKDWKDLTDEEILNFEGPQTGQMNRYDRIMQQRLILTLTDVRGQLNGLMETIYRFSQGLRGTITKSTSEMKESADQLSELYDKVSKDQGKQQRAILFLTIVVAISTALYTYITWQSVSAMREANEIQREFLELEERKASGEGI
jgi:hypothetical protein